MFQEAKCSKEQDVLRSKVCQGVKCVEKESELGCKVFPRSKVFLGAKCGLAKESFGRNKSLEKAVS